MSVEDAIWDLYECELCSAKPGAATLCVNCYERRQAAGGRWRGTRPNVQTLLRPDAKPWEEDWEVFEANPGCPAFAARTSRDEVRVFESLAGEDDDAPRARLAAAAPELVRVLLSIEWGGRYHGDCPSCAYQEHNGHATWCWLNAALRKAGVRG